jgi:predicted RNase H-like HicB family nuclease
MKRSYPLIIEQAKEGLFGFFPDLPGLTVAGETRDEVVAHARDFLRDYLADYRQRGLPWPDATQAIGLELVEIEEAETSPRAPKAVRR